jgi:3-oxoacyl-[acyl-carrier protein] reductase
VGELSGKSAVITGAGRGIGRDIALRFAREGANVVCMDKDEATCRQTAEDIQKLGVGSVAISGDVTSFETAQKTCDACVQSFGRLDILINNAGITRDGLLLRMSEQDWDLVLDINLKGMFLFTKAAARTMMKQRAGSIVNLASVAGVHGNPGQANYSSSKAGAIGLTKTCAKELGSRGIRVNAVAPGFIVTDMTNALPEDVKAGIQKLISLDRFGTTAEVAEVVLFLAGDRSSYVTGQVLLIDGGLMM